MSRYVKSEPLTITAESVARYLRDRGLHGSADLVQHLDSASQEAWRREQQWRAVATQLRERLERYEPSPPMRVDPGPTRTGD